MRKKIIIPSKEILDKYSDEEYLCYVIAFHAAPTIARKKASSLITLKNSDRKLKDIWIKNQDRCKDYFPLEHYCLCERENSVTVLFYHSDLLEECLNERNTMKFLEQYGYRNQMKLIQKLDYLAERYKQTCPHEIGVFLDYPLHDVKAFSECSHEKCILTGYWKVYAEEKTAIEKFREFDSVKNQIISALAQGISPKQVAFA